MKDFTLSVLARLYESYQNNGFHTLTCEHFMQKGLAGKTVILRHDVDLKPGNSLKVAQLQNSMGIEATYYFRIVPESFDKNIIKEIASLGHEIGYHYEDLALCRGNFDKAAEHFEKSLSEFRKIYPVKTICMHGSPLSKQDNRDLWKKASYRDFGVICEPYFDLDFTNGIYITDTGRCWNGDMYSIRDRIKSGKQMNFSTTFDIIRSIESGTMPDFIMQNFHPQRWTDQNSEWLQELIMQRIKNIAKASLRKIRN